MDNVTLIRLVAGALAVVVLFVITNQRAYSFPQPASTPASTPSANCHAECRTSDFAPTLAAAELILLNPARLQFQRGHIHILGGRTAVLICELFCGAYRAPSP
jgi:hypothetical protein